MLLSLILNLEFNDVDGLGVVGFFRFWWKDYVVVNGVFSRVVILLKYGVVVKDEGEM